MYTLDDLAELDVSYPELNEAINDAPNNVHIGFRLLDPVKSARCIAGLRLDQLITPCLVTPATRARSDAIGSWTVTSDDGEHGNVVYEMPARKVVLSGIEARLVRDYRHSLERLGHECGPVFISEYSGFTDLCDKTDRVLIEAKGSVERHRIREAIGQLYDYVRFLPFRAERLVVLRPDHPAQDLVQLLNRLGVDVIYRDEEGFATLTASGVASWRALLPNPNATELAAQPHAARGQQISL